MSNSENDVAKNLEKFWTLGKQGSAPVSILATINTLGFGEFISRLLYVNSVAQLFDASAVTLVYRDDLPFKSDLVKLLPAKNVVPIAAGQPLPQMDIVSPRGVRFEPLKKWYKDGLHHQDLVITEGMATDAGLLGFERLGYLSVPEDIAKSCAKQLVEVGVDPNRWFCTIHARESGFPHAAKNEERNADLGAYLSTIVHIIEKLGGQVVRLGHPEMTRLPDIAGLIQLGLQKDTVLLQAFAVSRSRFMLAGPSGPMAFGEAFHVPVAYANAWDWSTSNDRAVIRTIDLLTNGGDVINQYALADIIPLGWKALSYRGWRARQIPASEMIRLVNRVFEITNDVQGWRAPDPLPARARPNQFVWPGIRRPRGQLLTVPV